MIEKINIQETKNKILSIIRLKGPCLPVHISQELKLTTLFSSALLSELVSEKAIKISNLKVGGSPLYFLFGQENQLEFFSKYFPGKEKEAFSLLKQKSILEDGKLEPAIRVALRNIKDFAFPFQIEKDNEKKLFWRFFGVDEQTASNKVLEMEKTKVAEKQEKPLLLLKQKETKKTKEKSGFVNKVTNLLEKENLELLEEKSFKKKEYTAIIRINSDLGKIKFLCIAKDKKTITENDLALALQNSQTLKLPVLFISPADLNKKALNYLEQYSSIIKFKKLN